MASLMEIMQLCRLCLVKDQVNIPIFEEQGDIRQIFLKISACLPVKVSREDDLPKKICDECSYKLEILYQFWNTSANSEKQLLKWLSQVGAEKGPASDKVAVAPVQPHSMPSDGVILKQEVVDLADSHSADEIAPDDLNVSSDAQDYIMQQQQLTYQPISFQFQQDGFAEGEGATNASGPSATVTSEATEAAPKRKRRAAAMKALPAHIDSEEEDEDDVDMVETKIAKTEEQSDDSGGEDPEPTAFVGVPSTSTDNEQPGPSGVGKGSAEAPFYPDYLMPIVTIKEINPLQARPRGRPRKNHGATAKAVVANHVDKRKQKQPKQVIVEIKEEPKSDDESDLRLEKSELKFICHVCKSDAKMTEKELRIHFRQEHKGKRLRSMKLHPEDAVQCDICPKFFRTVKSLKEHMETHSNQFNCEICNTHFKKMLDYTIHLRLHNEEDVFKCVLCDFKTDSINEITDHLNSLHDQKYKYTCQQCGKGFHVLSWFEEHGNYHTGLKPFECEYCGKQFPYSRYLAAHKNGVHKEDITGIPTVHECVICKKQYQHKNSLKLHMNIHTGNVAVCDICGKTLSSKEKLKFHMRTHTGYKPFSCSFCGKCFTKKPILVEHERIHTGEKPYTCEYCFRGFSQRSSLVIHMRGHTGERPYVCHICNKGFVARAMLNIHFRTCKGML